MIYKEISSIYSIINIHLPKRGHFEVRFDQLTPLLSTDDFRDSVDRIEDWWMKVENRKHIKKSKKVCLLELIKEY